MHPIIMKAAGTGPTREMGERARPAKAYRLLRAVLMTAVEEDKILLWDPCHIREADDEDAPERPVLTVAQVFALGELVGGCPVGNVSKIPTVDLLRPLYLAIEPATSAWRPPAVPRGSP
jgi:hypothetical protein